MKVQDNPGSLSTPPPKLSLSADPQEENEETVINIVLAGAERVGKTSILGRFVGDRDVFASAVNSAGEMCVVAKAYEPTIGADFRSSTPMEIEGAVFRLHIWDSSGNAKMRNIGRTLYKDSDCLLLVFDITSLESFAALDAYLANYILYGQHEDPTDFSVIVVGNKADKASKRQVPVEAVHRWCELQRPLKPLVYLECSALDNKGVKEVFTEAARMVYNFMNYEEGSSRFSDAPLTSNMSRMSETDDFEYDKNTSTTSALIGSFSTPINTGASANTTEISPIFDHDEIYRGVAGSSRGSTPFSSAKERGREQGTEEERMISSLRQQQNQLESPSLNPLFNAAKNSKNASSSSSSVTATGANTTDDITNREEEMGVFIRFLHKLMFDAFLPQRTPPVKDVEQQRQDLRSVSGDTCSERSLVIPRSSSPLLTAQQVSKTQQTTYKPLFSRALCVFDCGAGAGPVMSDGEDSERPKSPPPSRCGGRSATAASASQSTNSDSAAPNTSSSYLQQSKDMPEFNPDK